MKNIITYIGHDNNYRCCDCHNFACYKIVNPIINTKFYACNLCINNWEEEEEKEEE